MRKQRYHLLFFQIFGCNQNCYKERNTELFYFLWDPSFERDYEELEKKAESTPEIDIKVVCYYLAKNKNVTLDVTNKTKVIDVKKAFAKEMGIKYDKYNIRFLFKGQELLNDHLLCYNNVENQSKIQVMASKKES